MIKLCKVNVKDKFIILSGNNWCCVEFITQIAGGYSGLQGQGGVRPFTMKNGVTWRSIFSLKIFPA